MCIRDRGREGTSIYSHRVAPEWRRMYSNCPTQADREMLAGIATTSGWIDGLLVSLLKGKGRKSDCDHHRGITLLESAGKVLARILLDRLIKNICPIIVPEAQCGFTEGRGTVDMVFTAR